MSELVERQESARARRMVWFAVIGIGLLMGYVEYSKWRDKGLHFGEYIAFCIDTHERDHDDCTAALEARGEACYADNRPGLDSRKHRDPGERHWKRRRAFYRCVSIAFKGDP